MSGYKVQRTTFKLTFSDPEHEGMEVRVRAMSMGERIHAAFGLAWGPEDDPKTRMGKQRELHEMFIEHLVDWNLTEEDEDETPIPATLEGLHSLEPEFLGMLIGTWQVGRSAVPAPLGSGSPSGVGLSQVEDTLMNIPSESLAS